MNGQSAKTHTTPMHKVTYYVLDPISGTTMKIEQEWRGEPDHLAGIFHEKGIMVETPNGNSTWYNPSTIVRMTFKKMAEEPLKKQTLMSKTQPDVEENVAKAVEAFKNLEKNIPF